MPVHAWQQSDSSDPSRGRILEFPDLGPIPGVSTPPLGPGAFEAEGLRDAGMGIIGGRRRTGPLPRQARSVSRLGGMQTARGMQLPETLPAPVAAERSLAIGTGELDRRLADDEGPEDGLTLDAAIERMMTDNLDIRALRHELTQADADILTAGLRTNPLVYLDSQFIPYGSFGDGNPGGPTQYDLNITYPLDVSRKRQARTVVARMAKTALEAQFQDVVRRQIDNVNKAFVGLQAARIDMLAAEGAVRRTETLLRQEIREAQALPPSDVAGRRRAADLTRELGFVLEKAKLAALDATEAFEDAQETLALLLGVPPEETADLVPRGGLRPVTPPPPPLDEMVRLAGGCRPDVRAVRLGVDRARAEVDLQRANRVDDVYLFYDPITIQDNSPYNRPSAQSWAVGLTFSLPVFNRNQGNIARAQSNVSQTRTELASIERRVSSEVRLADREYHASKRALERIEEVLLPQSEARLREAQTDFDSGASTVDDLQEHLEEAAAVSQSHRQALLRHRRSMLDVNTAVGMRVLP
jgi:cobalt-zinc-cadmium efflux system outer membrane protein